jgi:L-iditol 2-dehydrogenase
MTKQQSSSGAMRRVVVSTGRVDVVRADIPQPGPGEVLVRSVLAGVCGSDTHAAAGLHPWISLPYVPGHEVVGVVTETGAGVSSVQPGRRVTVEPYLLCWHCKQCLRGLENICENLGFLGCGDPQGAMADYFTLDARRIHVIPDELDDRAAALIEPLSTPVNAVRLAGGVARRTVAVLRAGSIGLLLLRTVVAQGAKCVVVTAPRAERRQLALALGADAAVDPFADDAVDQVRTALGESADVVFDCVATPKASTKTATRSRLSTGRRRSSRQPPGSSAPTRWPSVRNRELFGDLPEDDRFTSTYLAVLDSLHRKGARATLHDLVG